MNTPAAALTWELWSKYRKHLLRTAGIILVFAVIYPRLCAMDNFDPHSANALDELVHRVPAETHQPPGLARIVSLIYFMCLTLGPPAAMVTSLLYVVWMFTFTELDPRTKDPMTFPARLFTLPISTPFLFGWLTCGGVIGMTVFYWGWMYLVPVPHVEVFEFSRNWFGWITILVVAQAVVWSLAAWPAARMLILMGLLFAFMASFQEHYFIQSTLGLSLLCLLGLALGYTGLQKIRHGQWQQWIWQRRDVPSELKGPKQFASPAQAQLWFEWRRFGRNLSLAVAGMAALPVIIHVVWSWVGGVGRIEPEGMLALSNYFLFMPLAIYAFLGATAFRTDWAFLMFRPVNNGQIVTAILKAAALSVLLSLVAVGAAVSFAPLLGDMSSLKKHIAALPVSPIALALGVVFLWWRAPAVNICFLLTGTKKWMDAPILLPFSVGAIAFAVTILNANPRFREVFHRLLPGFLAGLLMVKFILAAVAFYICRKRRLLDSSTMMAYFGVWLVLAVAGLAAFSRIDKSMVYPISLGIILLVPLARIGLSPIALAWNRHG